MIGGISKEASASWNRYNRVNDPLGVFVVNSLMTAPGGKVYEVPAVAILDRQPNGVLWLRFHPGVTGHENYIFDAAFVKHVRSLPAYGEPNSKFPALGPSLNEWALNSGGSGYRKWAITMASMHEIVGAFAPLLEVK